MAKKQYTPPQIAKSYDDAFEAFNEVIKNPSHNQGFASLGEQASSKFRGYDLGLGKSKYDSNISWNANINEDDPKDSINENRADQQSGLGQLGLGVARATVKALTEVAKLPGVVVGSINAINAPENEKLDTAFNNAWIKSLDQFNEEIKEEYLPVYTAKAVRDGNLWDNITSTAFWANEGADGLGFILGMMAPGAAFELMGLGSKMIEGVSESARLAKFMGMSGKAEEAVSVLKGLGITGKSIDTGLAVMSNTVFEAGAEAKGVGDDLDRKKDPFIANLLKQGYSREEAEENFKQQRALAMRNTFVSNIGVLLGPNAIMHKAIWGKTAEKFEKTVEEGARGILNRVAKSAKRVGTAFASEGLWEEGSQTTIENLNVKRALDGKQKDNIFLDPLTEPFYGQAGIGDYRDEYLNTLNTTDGQKAIFLGGALGGPMMSIQGRRQDVQTRKYTNTVLDNMDKSITNFNTIFDNDVYKKNTDGSYIYKKDSEGNDTSERELDRKQVLEVAKALDYTEKQSQLLDEAIKSGDRKTFEKLKQDAIFNLILPAIHSGEKGIEALEKKLDADSKFNEIVDRDKKSDKKKGSRTFVDNILENAKDLQKENEKFKDFSRDVIELDNVFATPEQKERYLNKLNASYLYTKDRIRHDEVALQKLENKRNNIIEELGLDPLYDRTAEFPTAKMKNGIINDENLEERADKTKKALEEHKLLKATNDEYEETKARLEKYKKDIANIWQGKDVSEAFDDFIKNDNKLDEELSDESVEFYQGVIDEIKAINDKESLIKYVKGLDDKYKGNIQIQDQINDQLQEIEYQEQLQQDLKKANNIAQDKDKFQDDATGTDTKPEETTSVVDKQINNGLTTVQTSDNPEVNENNEITEYNPLNVVTLDENTNPEYSDKNQGSARIISTYKDSGEAIPGLEKFVEYEKEPRDKTKDKVTFSLGDVESGSQNKETKQILDKLKKGEELTKDEIKALENYLPIKVTLSNKETTSNDIETKKADIERRKQEVRGDALERIGIDRVGFDGKQRQDWKDAKNQDLKIATNHAIERLSKNPNVKIASLPSAYANAIKAELEIHGVKTTDKTSISEIIEKLKEINAKYDAELTALENNSASSYLDAMSHPNPDIVARETLPLRKAIVEALIANKGSFDDIEGKVDKQFTGTLQLGKQGSNILDLDVFKNMSEKEKLNYFKKNTVYVSNKGEVRYTATDAVDNTTSLKSSNRGEVFLKIPMINGKMFYLKLNISRLSEEKAQATVELIILKSNLLQNKEELSSDELQDFINNNGLQAIQTEFDFVKRNTDTIDQTLDRLINFIVYSQNTNAKTKLILGNDGTLVLGELLHKVNSDIDAWSGKLESYTYDTQTLNDLNDYQKQAIVEYLKYKRHNVLITKDNIATFNNDDYLKYLLGINSDYPILTTNAVVNEPTFTGYSNIYLNQSITNKNKVTKVIPAEETKVEPTNDLLSKLDKMYGGDMSIEVKSNTTESHTFLGEKIDESIIIPNDTESKEVIEKFNKSSEVKQLEMLEQALFATGKTLDSLKSDNIEQEFADLIKKLKETNKNSEIKKICGH